MLFLQPRRQTVQAARCLSYVFGPVGHQITATLSTDIMTMRALTRPACASEDCHRIRLVLVFQLLLVDFLQGKACQEANRGEYISVRLHNNVALTKAVAQHRLER